MSGDICGSGFAMQAARFWHARRAMRLGHAMQAVRLRHAIGVCFAVDCLHLAGPNQSYYPLDVGQMLAEVVRASRHS